MIPIVKEPEDFKILFGLRGVYEVCYFCAKDTDYWHWRTNQPVCPSCAKTHKVAELPKCHPKYKVPTKSEYLKPNRITERGKERRNGS